MRPALILLFPFLLGPLSGVRADAALITGNYQINWDQDVDKTATETTDVKKFKQTLELKYKGLLSPIVQNEISFKVEQEINSNAPDTTRLLPTLDLGVKGRFLDAKAGGKRTHENSDEPGKNPIITDSFFVELFYLAPRNVPDLKIKYTIDTDFEEGATDTRKDGFTASTVYKPTAWLDLKADFTKDTSDDRLQLDSDTKDQKRSASAAIRHLVSDKVKVDLQYSLEEIRGATLIDAGGTTNKKEDETHTVKSALSFRPFRDTSLDGSFDFDLKQNMENGEHTLTRNAKAIASQKVGTPFDVKGEFTRNIVEARHTADDNEKVEDTWTVDLKAKFSKQLDFTFKYQDKHLEEDHFADPSKFLTNTTITRSASWTGELAPFWKASASVDRTDTYLWLVLERREFLSTVDTKYALKTTFDFKAINLTLDPSYDITLKDDRVNAEETETRDFKFKVAYKILSTRTIEAKFDHTYGRKTDSGAGNIQRTDNSSGNVAWKEPFPGWTFGFDLTRAATDTSEDDIPPDITSTFGFKADYKYEWLTMGVSYKYDKKELTFDGETFDAKAGWTARKWDVSLTYSFNKTFSDALDEGYSLSLTFKYNL